MKIWDVIVIGAGPAGATAARIAAERGCDVLLLERAAIPRYKTCGGGLIGASLAALPPGLPLKALDTPHLYTFSLDGARERTLVSHRPTCTMVNRSDFDAALTEAAAGAGTVVRDATVLSTMDQDGTLVEVRTQRGETLRSRALVGADGSASRVARHVGVRCYQVDLALEVEAEVDSETAARWHGRMLIEWGPLPGSFGWVFPKGNVCTAGVVASRGNPHGTREYMRQFLGRHDLLTAPRQHDTGHLTRCRYPDSPLARGRAVVAGDAAGLIDPWTREGISYALRSGSLAGEAAAAMAAAGTVAEVDTAAAEYRCRVERTLGPDMRASGALMWVFTRNPGLVHGVLTRLPPAWHRLDGLLAGDVSTAQIMGGALGRAAMRMLIAIAARYPQA